MILDYTITRWCHPLEEGSTEEGVGDSDSGFCNFWGGGRGVGAREPLLLLLEGMKKKGMEGSGKNEKNERGYTKSGTPRAAHIRIYTFYTFVHQS